MSNNGGIIGVSDHGGWAVLVTVARWNGPRPPRVELVEEGLPKLPHSSEYQRLLLDEAVALVSACVFRRRGMRCLRGTRSRWRCRVS
jgi:hypothetical protein